MRIDANRAPLENSGFTLLELLVVVTMIGILCGLLVAALSKAMASGRAAGCKSNSRQVALAVLFYLEDNNEVFPICHPHVSMGGEWLNWHQFQLPFANSPILRHAGNFSRNLFRCPSDKFLALLESAPQQVEKKWAELQKYPFSYTLSSTTCVVTSLPPQSQIRWGIASQGPGKSEARLSRVKVPSQIIMLAEEATAGENAAREAAEGPGGATAYSSAWRWFDDPLTDRHHGRSNTSFVDGHVSAVKPTFGRMMEHCDPVW